MRKEAVQLHCFACACSVAPGSSVEKTVLFPFVMTPLLKICHGNFVWDLTKIPFCCLLSTSEMSFLLRGREWEKIAFLVVLSR